MHKLNPTKVFVLLAMVCAAILFLLAAAWIVFYFGIYLGYGNYRVRGHQQFAANGIAQIAPASQMHHLFKDCRNYIVYGGDSASIWNSTAYIGGRYELTMQVPVKIESRTQGKMIGEPRFYLHEVETVSISASGQIAASFSASRNFGPVEWKMVAEAGGDFGAIGFPMKTGPPVKGFDAYARASR